MGKNDNSTRSGKRTTMAGGSWMRSSSIDSNSSTRSIGGASSSSRSSACSVIPSSPSSELCALMELTYKLGSVIQFSSVDDDVCHEAKLLMSLSDIPVEDENTNTFSSNEIACASSIDVVNTAYNAGRITPTNSVNSSANSSLATSASFSRRNIFCFTCPSLSLDDERKKVSSKDSVINKNKSGGNIVGSTPGNMLSRTLKLEDKDALRLSSEAMARNVIESFQKAMEWRIQSWIDSLSKVIIIKEQEMTVDPGNPSNEVTNEATNEDERDNLYYSNEALLVAALRHIQGNVQVREAKTSFKILDKVSTVDEQGSPIKKQKLSSEGRDLKNRMTMRGLVLGEGEYVYDVTYFLEMQCSLSISTPAGNVAIDINVPGKILGMFVSSAEEYNSIEKLTDVTLDLNTEMLASMIEKSSRIAVRSSVEAVFKGEACVPSDDGNTANCVSANDRIKNNIIKTNDQSPTSFCKKSSTAPSPIVTATLPSPLSLLNHKGTPKCTPKKPGILVTPAGREGNDSDSQLSSLYNQCGGTKLCTNFNQDRPPLSKFKLEIPDTFSSSNSCIGGSCADTFNGDGCDKFVGVESTSLLTNLQKQQHQAIFGSLFSARLPSKKFLPLKRAVITPQQNEPPTFVQRQRGPKLPLLLEVASALNYVKRS